MGAFKELAKAEKLSPDNPLNSLLQVEILAAEDRSQSSGKDRGNDLSTPKRAKLEQILQKHQANVSLAYYVAGAYASLGRSDEAFAALDQALVARSNWLIYLRLDPRFDSLRQDPRFVELLKKVGI